ncbi:hypothetical protein OVY48_05800 [Sphingobium sp. SA2]|jgi:hypothetical protein|uniref:Uncharacterized protein n=1 Tax=Sphingomonas leidyi TaxID=68569 RepID=A0A7X5V3P6_9SPHN|nr:MULTISPECIES: hypothetical protein [Sphingomonadaceae]MBN2974289.1 hypothetical protein [Roseomonas aeriglobus]MBQ8104741.1 hypothetical protein [Afipia sp.]OJY63312.1 MAG: hypothetical protein BGP16_18985 [Sphingobium sp. 66-54]MDT7532955.1 hypothetical protein [Sphingobium sp. SA2]NIJ67354.1 hypothetical protein [Sphingomonas leidyi]
MRISRLFLANRFWAMFCIALAVVFAGASLSTSIDKIQHAPGVSFEHDHSLFSDASIIQDHADDHHVPQPGDNDPSDHLPGSHHHHGDGGSAVPVTASADSVQVALSSELLGLAPDNQTPGLRIPGPERPPKSLAIPS